MRSRSHFEVRRTVNTIVRLFLLVLVFAAGASARNWRISDFHSSVSVDKDGGVFVMERISLVFSGAYNGIYRTIPVEYPDTARHSNYTLFLKVEHVTDEQGHDLKYESRKDGAYRKLKIYIPGATDTTKTVVISYSSPNAVRYFDDHDEFYWNVTGNDWPVPIDHASALVSFPGNASGSLRAQAFTGFYGSHAQEASAEVQGAQVSFETSNPLEMRSGMTIDVYIPKGILNEPSSLTKFGWFLRSNPAVFLPFWALLVMGALWYMKGRDPDAGISVAPMYEPPKDMTPAEVGTLIDDSVDPRDITSTIVDLAVKGYVNIKEINEKVLIFSHKDYELTSLKAMGEWSGLRPHERVMLENIFNGGQTTRVSSLKNQFYTAIPVIKQDIKAALKNKGMYLVDPDSANAYAFMGALVVAAPFAILQFTGRVNFFDSPVPTIVAIILAVLVIWLFGRQMTAKTLLGTRTRVQILGFQEFMNRVDADRLKRMPPDTFEKYLPFAMALGVEHQWSKAFAGIVHDPPSWYQGYSGGMFNPIYFSNTMGQMSSTMHEAFVAAPRSSSSGSGFGGGGFSSGGGFSGGGFGGGGGGAF